MENLVGGFFANAENFAQIMDIQYIRIIIKHKITFLSYSGLEGLVRPSESPQRLGYGGRVYCVWCIRPLKGNPVRQRTFAGNRG